MVPLDLSVRCASEADLLGVMPLVQACIAAMRRSGIDQWDDIYPALDRFSGDVAAHTLYIAAAGDRDHAGIFTVDGNQELEYAAVAWTLHDERVGVVHRLMVHPDFHGRGVVRTLMTHAERVAVQAGFKVLRLDAFSLNPAALRLYRGLGYHEAGEVLFRKGVFRCFEKRL
jgi:ribosomal protein S18 acetylase RimI-like enzyme